MDGGVARRVAAGVGLSGGIGVAAYRRGMLTTSGIAGSMLVGTAVFAAGGLAWSAVVVFFFVSSSLLSRLASDRKRRVAADKFGKSGTRDLAQTLANGRAGALAALTYALHPRQPRWLAGTFVGAFATATADTWATELGTLSARPPRLITTGRWVQPGTSGAVSLVGTLAAAAGGLALGAVASLALRQASSRGERRGEALAGVGLAAGLAGALCDSVLGATVQRVNWCPVCGSETERTVHNCGARTAPLRGIAWMGNDMVNLLSTTVGALVGTGLAGLMGRRASRC